MIQVVLPDGSNKAIHEGSSAADLAAAIGPGLAKSAVVAKVNGKIVDLSSQLADGVKVSLLTKKDPEALEVLRHSAAHLMADAILRLYTQAELTIGPAIDEGFYYDIHLRDGGKITPEDFSRIEAEMQRVAKEAHPFVRCAGKDEADEIMHVIRRSTAGITNSKPNWSKIFEVGEKH